MPRSSWVVLLMCLLAAPASPADVPSLAEIRQQLANLDPNVREAAIKRLHTLGDGALPAAPHLVHAISDDAPAVSRAALLLLSEWALLQPRTPELVESLKPGLPQLLKCLHSADELVQSDAAEVIAFMGPDAAGAAAEIVAALPGYNTPAAKHLCKAIKSAGPDGLAQMMAVFGECKPWGRKAIIDQMTLSEWPEDDRLLSRAAVVLARAHTEGGLEQIAQEFSVRTMRLKGLPLLLRLASDPQVPRTLRISAVESIRDIGPPAKAAAHKLAELLNDPELGIHAASAILLLEADAEAAIPAIEKAILDDDRRWINAAVLRELQRLADNPCIWDLLSVALQRQPRDEQIAIIEIIRGLRERVDLSDLLASLCSDTKGVDRTVRIAAAITLAHSRQRLELAIPALKDGLSGEDIEEPLGPGQQPDPFGGGSPFGGGLAAELDWLNPDSGDPPALIGMDLRVLCARALGRVGPAAGWVVESLRSVAADGDQSSERLQMECHLALLSVDEDTQSVVTSARRWAAGNNSPAARFRLAERLVSMRIAKETDLQELRLYLQRVPHDALTLRAVRSVGRAGPSAKAALPDLERLRFSTFNDVGDAAAQAILAIRERR